MDKYTEKLKKQITEQHIKPRPKIYFIAKNVLFWALFVVFVAIASMVTGTFIYRVKTISSLIDGQYPLPSSTLFLLRAFPVLWIIILTISIVLIIFSIKLTKKGYKYPSVLLIAVNLAIVLFIGGLHNAIGTDRKLHTYFETFPGMHPMEEINNYYWNKPDEGRLEGKIIAHEGNIIKRDDKHNIIFIKEFLLTLPPKPNKSFRNKKDRTRHKRPLNFKSLAENIEILDKTWKINFVDDTPHPTIEFTEGTLIKIIGHKISDTEFNADLIIPFTRPTKEEIQNFCKKRNPELTVQDCVDKTFHHAKSLLKKGRKN